MNKEQQQIIDEAYENFIDEVDVMWQKSGVGDLDDFIYDGLLISGTDDKGEWFARILTKEEFINKCKIDEEFSEKWELKIEERELTTEQRNDWFQVNWNGNNPFMKSDWKDYELDQQNVPTKQLTITYKDKTIEVYES